MTDATFPEQYAAEQERCRELLAVYKSIGQPGLFAHLMLSKTLAYADKAAAEGDLAAMIEAYKEMRECQ